MLSTGSSFVGLIINVRHWAPTESFVRGWGKPIHNPHKDKKGPHVEKKAPPWRTRSLTSIFFPERGWQALTFAPPPPTAVAHESLI